MTSQLPIGKVAPDTLRALVYSQLGAQRRDVLVHAQFGEDCAAIEFGAEAAVVTTDPITGAGADLGWYAVHVATNDLASTGAEPVAVFLTLLLAPDHAAEDLGRVMQDASAAAAGLGIEIAGGHSEVTSGIDRTIAVITAIGRVPRDRLLRSGGARDGDVLLLTKGAGIEGTAILASVLEQRLAPMVGEEVVARAQGYRDRISVLPEARAAAASGVARAMHDVTEGGVLGAAFEMAAASGIGIHIDAGRVPVLPETAAICGCLGIDPLGLIGSGALLVATPHGQRARAAIAGVGILAAEIGRFTPRERLVTRDGRTAPLLPPAGDELWKALPQDRAR